MGKSVRLSRKRTKPKRNNIGWKAWKLQMRKGIVQTDAICRAKAICDPGKRAPVLFFEIKYGLNRITHSFYLCQNPSCNTNNHKCFRNAEIYTRSFPFFINFIFITNHTHAILGNFQYYIPALWKFNWSTKCSGSQSSKQHGNTKNGPYLQFENTLSILGLL